MAAETCGRWHREHLRQRLRLAPEIHGADTLQSAMRPSLIGDLQLWVYSMNAGTCETSSMAVQLVHSTVWVPSGRGIHRHSSLDNIVPATTLRPLIT